MWTAQFLVFVWASISVSALKLPTYIKACSRNDPQLNECVVKQGIAAIPNFIHGDTKYRVPNLDPLDIEELSVRQGTRQVGLNLVIRQCKLHGLSNAVFTKARMDMKKRHVEWDFINTKGLQILGTYNISGQVLILPIIGSGDANITITGLTITYKYDFDLVKKNDGKEYMNLTTSELLFDIGHAYFHLDNLFNGDKLLGIVITAGEEMESKYGDFLPIILLTSDQLGDILPYKKEFSKIMRWILVPTPTRIY
ncbi:hypothetical protein J6590_052050 [Homalodisca vitripennis]|nr:hypothetical protein J6590_052050 [Homalodisca vitripennis]